MTTQQKNSTAYPGAKGVGSRGTALAAVSG